MKTLVLGLNPTFRNIPFGNPTSVSFQFNTIINKIHLSLDLIMLVDLAGANSICWFLFICVVSCLISLPQTSGELISKKQGKENLLISFT